MTDLEAELFGEEPGPSPERRGCAIKLVFLVAGLLAILFVLVLAGLVYIGAVSPDTFVLAGHEVPKRYVKQIEGLGLLEEGESIQFFYSDAMLDIEEGMYFVTDRKLVTYCEDWQEPFLAAFDEIDDVTIEYDESLWVDSSVYVEMNDESFVYFPLSSERGGDRRFFLYLSDRVASAR